jgi:hypothetical protein
MSDKIIPFRRKEKATATPKSLAEALSHLPESAPIQLQIVVTDPTTRRP